MEILNAKESMEYDHNKLPYHPCIHPNANKNMARIHLPVAEKCNMTCRYCARQHTNSQRGLPGTSSSIMNPQQAIAHLKKQRKIWGDNAVVGISGPGEPLANPDTFETLQEINAQFPSHPLCLCTNGLLLKDHIQTLCRLGIRVISMTVNGIDPKIVQQLQPGIKKEDIVLMGMSAAKYLIESQLEGLKNAAAAGMFVKVNTVVAKGVNDGHLKDLARVLARSGAGIMNMIPVIAPHKHNRLSAPDNQTIRRLRNECEMFLPQFRLCRQCQSDAAGIPGQNKKGGCCS